MIVKIVDGENEYYFSGEKVEKSVLTAECVKLFEDRNSGIFKINISRIGSERPNFKLANPIRYTTFVTKDSDGETLDMIITYNCKVYIMNEYGKTIDKYMGIIHINK